VTIRIFDVTGALVRRNLDASGVGVCNGMVWNGKDQAGMIVKGGIYIYQVEAGDKVVTGTVVVAK
jgi:flagellar hook assembly protein FlgD